MHIVMDGIQLIINSTQILTSKLAICMNHVAQFSP